MECGKSCYSKHDSKWWWCNRSYKLCNRRYGEVAYATSKAALVGFTKALAREFADKNIRVNAICPGYVRTPLVEGMAKQSDPENPERAIQAIADAVPLKRLADPEEVGELAAFLGCYESSYITGTQIVIDGGSTLPETTSMGQ